jgi:FAD/FMN-containing dehydrogenase
MPPRGAPQSLDVPFTLAARREANAIEANGGTTTHHHAVGRVHRPWYEGERGSLYLDALASAKQAVDPAGIMNPGVLLPEALGSTP